jgi:hypothetical protein
LSWAERGGLTANAVTDNLGNSYTAQNAGSDAGNATGRAFYSIVTSAGTLTAVNVDVTATSTDDAAVAADVYEGPFAASPLDANPANVTNDITSPFVSPATGTLAQADELIIAWIAETNCRTMSATAPFTLGQNVLSTSEGSVNSVGVAIARRVVSATTSVTCEWTAGGALNSDVLGIASFKKAAGAVDLSLPRTTWRFRPRRPRWLSTCGATQGRQISRCRPSPPRSSSITGAIPARRTWRCPRPRLRSLGPIIIS